MLFEVQTSTILLSKWEMLCELYYAVESCKSGFVVYVQDYLSIYSKFHVLHISINPIMNMNMLNYCYIFFDVFGRFDEVLGIFLGSLCSLGGLDDGSQGDCLGFVLIALGGLGGGSLGGFWRFVKGFQIILLSRWVISLQVKNSSPWLSLLQSEEKIDEHFKALKIRE